MESAAFERSPNQNGKRVSHELTESDAKRAKTTTVSDDKTTSKEPEKEVARKRAATIKVSHSRGAP